MPGVTLGNPVAHRRYAAGNLSDATGFPDGCLD
jgi:hypothetical protein